MSIQTICDLGAKNLTLQLGNMLNNWLISC